jgi:putative endonuclease
MDEHDSTPSQATRAPDVRKRIGTCGEADTAAFLEARGYHIVDANIRPIGGRRRGEIDLVAWDGDCLVFVEVKTRRARLAANVSPAEAVDWRKRRQLLRLAYAYIARYNLNDIPCRFDVVEVLWHGTAPSFNIIVSAFDAGDV